MQARQSDVQVRQVTGKDGRILGTVQVYPNMVKVARKQNKQNLFKKGFTVGVLVGGIFVGIISGAIVKNVNSKKDAEIDNLIAQYQDVGGDISQLLSMGEDVEANVTINYKIQEGESLWIIAGRLVDSTAEKKQLVESICADNNIKDPDLVKIGQVIKIIVPESKLSEFGYAVGSKSDYDEWQSLASYVAANEAALDDCEDEFVRQQYADLASNSMKYEEEYELAESIEDKEAALENLVRIYNLRRGIVEEISQVAYQPNVTNLRK